MPDKVTRHLPGVAARYPVSGRPNSGQVIFMRGVVNYSSERVQWVETDSKQYPLVSLIGETFLHYCDKCKCSVYETETQTMLSRGEGYRCPFCRSEFPHLHRVMRGDKVRLHFRYMPDASSAQWWAERWDW